MSCRKIRHRMTVQADGGMIFGRRISLLGISKLSSVCAKFSRAFASLPFFPGTIDPAYSYDSKSEKPEISFCTEEDLD